VSGFIRGDDDDVAGHGPGDRHDVQPGAWATLFVFGHVSAAARAGSPAPAADASSPPRKPKKRGPVPAGSSDLAGDGRQARKDLSLPAEAARDDQNLVQLALVLLSM
jgi:hypothetical protein